MYSLEKLEKNEIWLRHGECVRALVRACQQICRRFDIHVNVVCDSYMVDGCSALGVFGLVGRVVRVEPDDASFTQEIIEEYIKQLSDRRVK